jgi:hypothetical protein
MPADQQGGVGLKGADRSTHPGRRKHRRREGAKRPTDETRSESRMVELSGAFMLVCTAS